MLATLNVLAAEIVPYGHFAPSDPWAKAAVPVGIILFIGSIYLLLRSNLGTRRGYLVLGVSLWGFTSILAAFWAFGAPGTPPVTGPQTLPGQPLNEYEPTWTAFAQDSNIANDPRYDVAKGYPNGFGEVPEEAEELTTVGADEIKNFFSGFSDTSPYSNVIEATWVPLTDQIGYAVAEETGFPILAVPYVPSYQPAQSGFEGETPPITVDGETPKEDGSNLAPPGTEVGDPVLGAEPVVLFGFFDAGNPPFPSYVVLAIIVFLFVLHVALLARDEARERRDRESEAPTEEPVTVPAGAR